MSSQVNSKNNAELQLHVRQKQGVFDLYIIKQQNMQIHASSNPLSHQQHIINTTLKNIISI